MVPIILDGLLTEVNGILLTTGNLSNLPVVVLLMLLLIVLAED